MAMRGHCGALEDDVPSTEWPHDGSNALQTHAMQLLVFEREWPTLDNMFKPWSGTDELRWSSRTPKLLPWDVVVISGEELAYP